MNQKEQKQFDALKAENESLKATNAELLKEKGIDTIVAEKDAKIKELISVNDNLSAQIVDKDKTIDDLMSKVDSLDKENKQGAKPGVIKLNGTKYRLTVPKSILKGKIVSDETLKGDDDLAAKALEAGILEEIK